MIMGGGMTAEMKGKPTQAPIPNEADNGLQNDAYTVAMARAMAPHSATAQFFINVKKNDFLNHKSKTPDGWGYTVFGKVVKGHGVVNKLKGVATGRSGMHQDVPVTPVTIHPGDGGGDGRRLAVGQRGVLPRVPWRVAGTR